MLFTEYPVVALAVDPLYLQEVVGSPGAFDVERYHTARVLALDAGTVSLATNYALKIEALHIDLAHAHWGLWGHTRAWDPHGAAQMHPLIKGLGRNCLWTL